MSWQFWDAWRIFFLRSYSEQRPVHFDAAILPPPRASHKPRRTRQVLNKPVPSRRGNWSHLRSLYGIVMDVISRTFHLPQWRYRSVHSIFGYVILPCGLPDIQSLHRQTTIITSTNGSIFLWSQDGREHTAMVRTASTICVTMSFHFRCSSESLSAMVRFFFQPP